MIWRFQNTLFILAATVLLAPIQPIKAENTHKENPTHESRLLQTDQDYAISQAEQFQTVLIDLLDTLYTHLEYWQEQQIKPTGWASTTTQTNRIAAALHYLHYEADQQAEQLALVTELLKKNEYTAIVDRQKIIPNDLQAYKKEVIAHIQPYKKPSHLSRHWLKYTAGAVCALGAFAYWHHNKKALTEWITQTQESAKNFYTNYAYKPIKNAINIFYGKDQEKPFISPESIQQDEQILKTMIREFYKDNYASKKTSEQIEAIAQDAVQKRELPQEIADRYAQETKNPVKNLTSPWGQLGRLGIILGHIKALRLTDIIQKVDDLRQANRLNLELSVGIPTFLAGYGTYRALKGIYRSIHPREKNYEPIRKALLITERILNKYDNPELTMDYVAQGKVLYWVYKLSQLEYLIPAEHRSTFIVDLTELYSPTLLVGQKLRIIDRMYRTYAFLALHPA